jgi:cell division septation protein DedD
VAISLPALPGIPGLGKAAMASRLPAMPDIGGSAAVSRFSSVTAFFPLVLVVVLAVMNIVVLLSGSSADDERTLWEGPLMPGKLFPLPDPSMAKIISTAGVRQAPKEDEKPQELVVAEKAEAPPVVEKPVVITKKFIVQVGHFATESGVVPLVESLQYKGYNPKVRVMVQKTQLNNVQAGPYKSLEMARESEVKLRAVGRNVWVESSKQGYIINLKETINLAPALKEMERVEALDVTPLRLIKVDAFEPAHTVYMGPFNSKEKAAEVYERMGSIGLAIPKIKDWNPEDE